MVEIIGLIIFLFAGLFYIALLSMPIVIAWYIYSDAKDRGYKHIWFVTILGFLFGLIFFIIWLFIRPKEKKEEI